MTTKITDANLDSNSLDNTNFNIGLLGFKMAVNEGLTVFNLVDGVVDEFNDESGTDEAEGSNDYYCGTTDFYTNNSTSNCFSAGFTTTSITEPDTSTTGTNPATGSGTLGSYTVPSGLTSLNIKVWGSGGGANSGGGPGATYGLSYGGGGGFSSGTLAVTPGQTLYVSAGEGGSSLGIDPLGPALRTCTVYSFFGGGAVGHIQGGTPDVSGGMGGGVSGVLTTNSTNPASIPAPSVVMIAGSGGGGTNSVPTPLSYISGGFGGGLTAPAGKTATAQTSANVESGGGGTQSAGGCGGASDGQAGGFLKGGEGEGEQGFPGGGGAGYYGGGGGGASPQGYGSGGGGSSYYGHPQITSGATEAGSGDGEGGGDADPDYISGTNQGGLAASCSPPFPSDIKGDDGYVLLTGSTASLAQPGGGSTTIISTAFTSTSVATSARIVIFEENVDTPTLNTDIIASISRDGTNFTNATLSDSGYVTGSSGQRILTGQADISGQPSGQSMRWKLALANNTVKIHGVSLQWS